MQQLNWILDLPDTPGFVKALASEELYLLIHDIGAGDAFALLEYASQDQLRALTVMDAWHDSEPRVDRWLTWLDRAEACDVDTALRFIEATEDEFLQLLMCQQVQVHASDLDQDLVSDEVDLLSTPDGTFWVTVEHETDIAERLPRLMRLMWAQDADRMRDICQTSRFELPSALAESLLHFRAGQLEEMGFPSPDEALEIYRWVDPAATKRRVLAALAEQPGPIRPWEQGEVALDLALRGVTPPRLLGRALEQLDDEARARFGQAMTYVVNSVYMADTKDLSHTDALPDAARRAAALVNLGLEYVADEGEALAATILRGAWPMTLLRVGHSLTMEQSLLARRIRRRAGADRGLFVFGAPLDDVLQAVAQPRPMYFEGQDPGGSPTWRPFATLQELGTVAARLSDADAVLALFERQLGFTPEALMAAPLEGLAEDDRRLVRLSTLLRTGLANALLTDAFSFEPLDAEALRTFLAAAFEDGGLSPALTGALATMTADAAEPVVRWLERATEELVDALVRVRASDIEPAYVADLFLVKR
jgi:hypothetical protein